MRKTFLILLILLAGASFRPALAEPITDQLQITKEDRVIVFAPHPDDETLGAAGVIQKAVALKIPIRVVWLTFGDNNIWAFTVYKKKPMVTSKGMENMGEIRHQEAINAMKALGLSEDHLTFLGYPDYGTMDIWLNHWGKAAPFRSMTTKVTAVPYKNAFRTNAPYKGEEVLADIKTILRDFKPTKVFVTNSADENVDHRAYYLFTRVALWDLAKEMTPALTPFIVHYRFRHWPIPQGYHPEAPLTPPDLFLNAIAWMMSPLTKEEIAKKYEAIKAHKTQYDYSGHYLDSFMRTNELFGDFPVSKAAPAQEIVFEDGKDVSVSELPENFDQNEKDHYISLDKRKITVEDDMILLTTTFKHKLKGEVKLFVDLFGYRYDKPFEEMPKIRVEIGEIVEKVFDQGVRLKIGSIEFTRQPNAILMKVPKKLLGNPDHILTGVQSNLAETRLDCMSWRVLDLRP